MLHEFKPRKAAFGFKVEDFTIENIVPTGNLLEALKTLFEASDYSIEFGVPFRARDIKFKLYTDKPDVAAYVRQHFAKPEIP
jgi:hypothetical protein